MIDIKEALDEVILDIKSEIKNTQIKTIRQANYNLMNLYFNIGKILNEKSKYGNNFIKKVSIAIKLDYPSIKGFSERNLKRMKRFYLEYRDLGEKVPQAVAQLPWGHNILLFEKIKDKKIRKIYIDATLENGWSRNTLDFQIRSNYHKRVGNSINNFKMVLDNKSDLVNNALKDPYIFDFISIDNDFKERDLEKNMIQKIRDVILELGDGFSFVGNQYKLTLEGKDYYLDMLFYHLKLKCYVVVELKMTEFKPEYVGKMNFYLSLVDDKLKNKNDNPTIGLILCKDKNKLTVQYALKNIEKPIGVSSFRLANYLPSEKDLNLFIK